MNGPSEEREREAVNALLDSGVEIGNSIIKVISATDVAEVMEHVPILKIGVGLFRIAVSIRDNILIEKIRTFLACLASVPHKQRMTMLATLENDPGYRETIGEHLVDLIDRSDGKRKAAMLGVVFSAFAGETIDYVMLRRLCAAIERIPTIEIPAVRKLHEVRAAVARGIVGTPPDDVSQHLLGAAGLASGGSTFGGFGYSLNSVGDMFLQLNLDRV